MPFKPKEILKVLKRIGFVEQRQKGSHLRLKHPDGRLTVLPMHHKPVSKGLFQAILKQASLTEDAFRNHLR